jgi:2-C-methyl-D-erythritol 4-phosphate cytidylyltransferase
MASTKLKLRTVVVILAGGIGQRMGFGIPKQLIKVAGKPVIEHTVSLVNSINEVDEIIILMAPGFLPEANAISKKYSKVSRVIQGGRTRNETTKLALDIIEDEECKVLFHDAVRPLISRGIIISCINALDNYSAVDVAIPSADTIIQVDNGIISDIPDRSRLMRGQTPQAFLISTIREAYKIAEKDDNFQATDDCGVVVKYLPNTPVIVVEGSDQNMKITLPIDVHIIDKLFQLSTTSLELVDDSQLISNFKDKTIVIFGASKGIGASIALLSEKYGAKVFAFSRSMTSTHVESEKDVKKALKKAFNETGRIDYVVNTAGLLRIGRLENSTTQEIKELIDVNYTAPIYIAKSSLPYLRETKGQLLLFTSSSYTRGRGNYSLYSSSKAAIVNLTQALADEWEDVRINCINPERTATPMRLEAFGPEDPNTLLTAERVAEVSLMALVSDLTGQVFDVRRSID